MSAGDAARPQKKQKVNRMATMQGSGIHLSRLTRHQLDFEPVLSPGALHGNRVAIQAPVSQDDNSGYNVMFATGRDVYGIHLKRESTASLGQVGKGGVHLPLPSAEVSQCSVLPGVTLRSEVQSLHLSAPCSDGVSTLASTDCYGRTVVARLRSFPSTSHGNDGNDYNEGEDGIYASNSVDNNGLQVLGFEELQPADINVEGGWAGASIAPGQPSQVAVARHFPKDITLFDGPIPVRTIHTLYRPYCVQLLSSTIATGTGSNPVVVAAEGPMVSVWDVRIAGRGARVAKLCPSPHAGHLHCVAASVNGGNPLLGAAGADRSVIIWDPRKWLSVARWSNCVKYEITSLNFLSTNPSYCLAAGLDYEVVCGQWGGYRRNRLGGGHRTGDLPEGAASDATTRSPGISFRGDSRWMGVSKAQGVDVVAGLTSSKQVYVAEYSGAGAAIV